MLGNVEARRRAEALSHHRERYSISESDIGLVITSLFRLTVCRSWGGATRASPLQPGAQRFGLVSEAGDWPTVTRRDAFRPAARRLHLTLVTMNGVCGTSRPKNPTGSKNESEPEHGNEDGDQDHYGRQLRRKATNETSTRQFEPSATVASRVQPASRFLDRDGTTSRRNSSVEAQPHRSSARSDRCRNELTGIAHVAPQRASEAWRSAVQVAAE